MPRPLKGMFCRGRTWYLRVRDGGRDRWLSLGSDLEAANRQVREIRQRGTVPSRVTVAEAARRWLESYIRTARNAKCQRLAESRVDMYLARFFVHKQLSKVGKEDLRAYRLWLENQGRRKPLSQQSVHHILSDARCFFHWCEDAGLIDRSPFPRKLLPRIQERPPDRLGDEEVARLVALQEPYGFVLRLALGTGLRWGELCRAQASDVDNGALVVSKTKTGKVRRVPLSSELLAEVRGRVGKLVPFSPLSSGAFARMVQRLSGVTRFHPHQTRHTFACRWVEVGGNLAALQQILGHSTIVTTQRYARLSDEYVSTEAVRVFGRARAG